MTRTRKLLIAAGVIIMVLAAGRQLMPRGIRNKNPGNIKWDPDNDWHGQVGKDADGFAVFADPADGIDAMGEILDSYKRRGVLTVEQIINEWAPTEDDNDTSSYLQHVLDVTGWHPDHIPYRTEGDYVTLIDVIIKHENSYNPYSGPYIADALARVT